jgi:3',5'-cyclic AMP phosphodiesterase CpdA
MPDSGVTPQPVRLLHLSDIHFGAEDREALIAVEQFAAHVKPDAIIVAGDITQRGRRSEFEAARKWFDSLGAPIIAAPGNHDTPVYHLPARMIAPFDRYSRYMAGLDIVGRLAEFGGGLVRVSAINTARGFQGRMNWADGVIDLDDLEDALDRLSKGPAGAWRLLICHHPLDQPELARISVETKRGGEALRRCAAAKVDAIITGHIHDAFTVQAPGVRRPMVQMGSGTLSTRLRSTRPSFCVIQIDGEHMVQDVIVIDRNGLEVRRNYDSALAVQPDSGGETKHGTRQAAVR